MPGEVYEIKFGTKLHEKVLTALRKPTLRARRLGWSMRWGILKRLRLIS